MWQSMILPVFILVLGMQLACKPRVDYSEAKATSFEQGDVTGVIGYDPSSESVKVMLCTRQEIIAKANQGDAALTVADCKNHDPRYEPLPLAMYKGLLGIKIGYVNQSRLTKELQALAGDLDDILRANGYEASPETSVVRIKPSAEKLTATDILSLPQQDQSESEQQDDTQLDPEQQQRQAEQPTEDTALEPWETVTVPAEFFSVVTKIRTRLKVLKAIESRYMTQKYRFEDVLAHLMPTLQDNGLMIDLHRLVTTRMESYTYAISPFQQVAARGGLAAFKQSLESAKFTRPFASRPVQARDALGACRNGLPTQQQIFAAYYKDQLEGSGDVSATVEDVSRSYWISSDVTGLSQDKLAFTIARYTPRTGEVETSILTLDQLEQRPAAQGKSKDSDETFVICMSGGNGDSRQQQQQQSTSMTGVQIISGMKQTIKDMEAKQAEQLRQKQLQNDMNSAQSEIDNRRKERDRLSESVDDREKEYYEQVAIARRNNNSGSDGIRAVRRANSIADDHAHLLSELSVARQAYRNACRAYQTKFKQRYCRDA